MADVLGSQPGHGPPLASPPGLKPLAPTRAPRRGAAADRTACASRSCAMCPDHGLTPLVRTRDGYTDARRCERADVVAGDGQVKRISRRGGRRGLRPLRLRGVRRRPAVPPRRPGREVVHAQPSTATRARLPARGQEAQVRAAVRELPRSGRGWSSPTSPKIGRPSRLSCVAQARRSGVAQSAEHSTVNRRVVGSSPTPGARGCAAPSGAVRR